MIIKDNHTYTRVEGQWVCDDCGAHARTQHQVQHHSSCVPGSSEKWRNYYNQQEPEEVEYDYTQDGEGDGIIAY